MDNRLKRKLDDAHEQFFEHFGVDDATGMVNRPYLRFPTYPHVGSCYGAIRRLMIVGMAVGDDEAKDRIQSYEDRRRRIEDARPDELSLPMARTYVTALYFLKGECDEWRRWWEESDKGTFPHSLLNDTARLPSRNPLSYIALTNYYKFLLARDGGKVQLEREGEEQFLREEVKILDPDIIVLQSAGSRARKTLLDDLSETAEVYVGTRPAARGVKGWTGNFIHSIETGRVRST